MLTRRINLRKNGHQKLLTQNRVNRICESEKDSVGTSNQKLAGIFNVSRGTVRKKA